MLDNFLAGIDFTTVIQIDNVAVEMTGSKCNDSFGNKKLMNFGCEDQKYSVKKKGDNINIKVCGWTIGAHDNLYELYKFLIKSKNMVSKTRDTIINEMSEEAYVKQLIEEVERCKNQKNLKN